MVAYVFSFIDRQILSLLIGPIKADLHLSDTQFGLLQGLAFSLFYATMGIPIASLADRFPRSLIIVAGVAFWSMATMACGLAGSFAALFIARLGVGAGEAALSPATYSLISDLFPREKLGRALGIYSMGSFLGSGIAFLVGGSVIGLVSSWSGITFEGTVIKSWHLVFLIVGVPGILLAGIIALLVHEPRRDGVPPRGHNVPSTWAVFRFLIERRAIFLPHIFGFSLMAISLYVILGWAPAYLMRSFGMTPAECGLRLGAAVDNGRGGRVRQRLVHGQAGDGRAPRCALYYRDRGVPGHAGLCGGPALHPFGQLRDSARGIDPVLRLDGDGTLHGGDADRTAARDAFAGVEHFPVL
jgi:MFS family permease